MTNARNLLLSALLVLLSCTPGGGGQPNRVPTPSTATAATVLPSTLATPGDAAPVPNEERQQPLAGLGPCDDPPASGGEDPVEGFVLPDGATVTQVTPAEPLTNVQGYLEMTPVQMRVFYQQHPELKIISVEDEVFEAEVLYEAEGRRVFMKSQAVCELGSVFVAVVSPVSAPTP